MDAPSDPAPVGGPPDRNSPSGRLRNAEIAPASGSSPMGPGSAAAGGGDGAGDGVAPAVIGAADRDRIVETASPAMAAVFNAVTTTRSQSTVASSTFGQRVAGVRPRKRRQPLDGSAVAAGGSSTGATPVRISVATDRKSLATLLS